MREEKYINLKEASEISGYSPDYIGQLIRKGKIKGKQVYFNTAWMVTEEEIREYVEQKNNGREAPTIKEWIFGVITNLPENLKNREKFLKLFKIVLYFAIILTTLLLLLLLYIFSTSLEYRLNQKAIEKFEVKNKL